MANWLVDGPSAPPPVLPTHSVYCREKDSMHEQSKTCFTSREQGRLGRAFSVLVLLCPYLWKSQMLLSTRTCGFSLMESPQSIFQTQCPSLTSPRLASSGSGCTRRWPNRGEESSQSQYVGGAWFAAIAHSVFLGSALTCVFDIGSPSEPRAGLEIMVILLLQLPGCWSRRSGPFQVTENLFLT